jgi:hypothetical protein
VVILSEELAAECLMRLVRQVARVLGYVTTLECSGYAVSIAVWQIDCDATAGRWEESFLAYFNVLYLHFLEFKE